MTGCWTGFGGYVICHLSEFLCMKTEGLVWLFHCTSVKEKGLNVVIIEVLARLAWLEKYMHES